MSGAVSKAVGLLLAVMAMAALLAPSAVAEPRASLTEIEKQVMCPVCGTLLQLAESPQAQREKAFIQRLIAAGKTEAQIKDALVAEYGTEVLALPQDSGFSLSAYVVPIVAFLVAAIHPKEIIAAAGDGQIKEFIGTGPYRFVEHRPDRHIKLARFKEYAARHEAPDGYGGRRTAYIDEILFI
ncbi:MAG TPA: cytochrome c-type biogenesis protein CcmH, partial [Solirubrobacterales bacterium]|nr:cytochrome c-type biogenesis protein CcmH [Solirubrobacterales bacterium]